MSEAPPPLPPMPPPASQAQHPPEQPPAPAPASRFYQEAATASIAAPLLAMAITLGMKTLSQSSRTGAIIAATTQSLFMIAGISLAIYAFVKARQAGDHKARRYAAVGLVINLIYLTCVAIGLVVLLQLAYRHHTRGSQAPPTAGAPAPATKRD